MQKRKRSRVQAAFHARILAGGTEYALQTKDISLKGLLCSPEPGLQPGQQCEVELHLDQGPTLSLQARVVRSDPQGTAIDFRSMEPETFQHLRNLIRFHSKNPDAIDQELSQPAFDPKQK
ncbi:MAG: PilZ domain-containing protein [Thermodesulfobacteriota bacterium]